jgi:hypothetical protein
LSLFSQGGYPQIIFSSQSPFTAGSYTINSQSPVSAVLIKSVPQSIPESYSSAFPNSQVTLNFTSVGSVGGIAEGTFSGTIGKAVPPSSVSYINISGSFKAYIHE